MYQISNSLNGGKSSALQKADSNGGICFLLGKYQPKIISLCDWPFETKVIIVFDSLFTKFSLLSQKNSSLSFIVLPTTRKACLYWLVATFFFALRTDVPEQAYQACSHLLFVKLSRFFIYIRMIHICIKIARILYYFKKFLGLNCALDFVVMFVMRFVHISDNNKLLKHACNTYILYTYK